MRARWHSQVLPAVGAGHVGVHAEWGPLTGRAPASSRPDGCVPRTPWPRPLSRAGWRAVWGPAADRPMSPAAARSQGLVLVAAGLPAPLLAQRCMMGGRCGSTAWRKATPLPLASRGNERRLDTGAAQSCQLCSPWPPMGKDCRARLLGPLFSLIPTAITSVGPGGHTTRRKGPPFSAACGVVRMSAACFSGRTTVPVATAFGQNSQRGEPLRGSTHPRCTGASTPRLRGRPGSTGPRQPDGGRMAAAGGAHTGCEGWVERSMGSRKPRQVARHRRPSSCPASVSTQEWKDAGRPPPAAPTTPDSPCDRSPPRLLLAPLQGASVGSSRATAAPFAAAWKRSSRSSA